jgi:hypothetical protein
MTSNDDSSGSRPFPGSGSASPGAKPKRPHATLDLQAVEIKPRRQKPSTLPPATDSTDKTGTNVESQSDKDQSNTPKTGQDKLASSTPQSEDVAKTESGGGNGSNTPPPRRRGGFFSHLFAGIVGGAVAFLGGDWAINKVGIPMPFRASMQGMDSLESRMAQLEEQVATAPSTTPSSGDTTAVAQLESQTTTKLTALSSTIADINKQQQQLSESLTELAQTTGTAKADADLSTRLTSLEEQLSTLSLAAENGDDSGPIPQMAALTTKIAELEQKLQTELAKARTAGVPQDVDARVTEAETAAVAAKSDTERLDRDLSGLKTNTTRLDERVEALKVQADRLAESLKLLQEADAKTTANLSELKRDLTTELGTVAKPEDINQAVTPFTTRVDELEQQLARLEKLEAEGRANARKVVTSLELANMKRILDNGEPFETELKQVKSVAGHDAQLSNLDPYASTGVPSVNQLQQQFTALIPELMAAAKGEDDSSLLERFVNQAKSVVRVRKVAVDPNDSSVEAVIARMENALKAGDLEQVLKTSDKLPEASKAAANPWLDKVKARHAVNAAMASLEQDLKSALSQPAPTAAP